MTAEVAQTIVGYLAIAVPVTVAIGNLARIGMEWLSQRHKIRTTVIQQTHDITTHYLDRALDPQVPIAFRHQLLRFLATPDQNGSRLQIWADGELKRIGSIVDETNRAVQDAENEIHAAKNAAQVDAAERKLTEAIKRQKSLMEPPANPPLTAAALRSGLFQSKDLSGLEMRKTDLSGMSLPYCELRGADFSESNLTSTRFQGADLRAARFDGAKLGKAVFHESDLRGASFVGALLEDNDFSRAHLEGADFSKSQISNPDLRATYDSTTRWPEGFNPDAAGAVCVNRDAQRSAPVDVEPAARSLRD